MSETARPQQPSQQPDGTSRRAPSKRALVVLGVLLLLALAYFLLPHPIKRLYTVDGQDSWSGDSIPIQRQIAWQTPQQIDVNYADGSGKESLIHPLLADNGNTLYFTLRKQNGESDIYRSHLVDGQWGTAEPVAQLNSPADDIGGFISADGKRFYLSSDRKEGGHGGFDLYVSAKTGEGWSEPRNLGPRINTPANEYSPTVAADGRRLYFSSNRNRRMQKRAALIAKDAAAEWDETLRAQQGLVQYDLYVAEVAQEGDAWQAAELLAGANLENSNEGTPYVSSSGVFFYFTSDRPNASGDRANYDIYRARLGKTGVSAIENLGPGVNSAANEMDPALSLQDFQLIYSSDRDSPNIEQGADDLYALYTSTAVEVYAETEWTESRLAPLVEYWWWILLALLSLALLCAVIWYFRHVSWRRAPVPAFLLIALLVHMLLATGLFFVGLGGELADKVKQELEDLVGMDFGEDPEEIHPTERPVFDKVTDLQAVETVQPTDVTRQVAAVPNVPIPTQSLSPALPTVRVEDVPTEQILVLPPKAEVEVRELPQLTRRRTVDAAEFIEPPKAATETPITESPAPAFKLRTTEIDLARLNSNNEPAPLSASVNQIPLESRRELPIEPSPLAAAATPTASPPSSPTNPQLVRAGPSVANAIEIEKAVPEKAELDKPKASRYASAVDEQVDLAAVNREPSALTIPGALANDLADTARPLDAPTAQDIAITSQPASGQVIPASHDVKLELSRQPRPGIPSIAMSEPVSPEPTGVDNTSTGGSAPSQRQKIDVSIQHAAANATPPRADLELGRGGTALASRTKPTAEPMLPSAAAANAIAAAGSYSGAPTLTRQRASLSSMSDQAETEAVASRTSSDLPSQQPVVAGVTVGVDHPEAEFLHTPVRTELKLGGVHNPRLRRLVLGGKVGEKPIDAPLRLAIVSSGLPRRSTRGAAAFYADAGAGLERMFDLRRSEAKTELVKMFGGNEESLKAVERSLTWIEKHQFPDGHWSLHEFNKCCKDHQRCSGHSSVKSDVAATGFGLLPFLGFGETHLTGSHQDAIGRGLRWLVENQQSSGELTTGKEGNARMYSHAIGAIALCEAYGLSQDPNLRDPAQRALEFIVKAQHKSSGGWRYQPNQSADTSVVGWQLMALKSGQIAGLHISHESFALVAKWLDQVEGKGKQSGQFRYQPGRGFELAMTAEALLCRRYLGATLNDEAIVQGANHLLNHLPQKNKDSSYYWYYATQFMFHLSPQYWEKWNDAQRDMLTETQIKDGQHFGTWDPKDNWEHQGGRLYATSLRVMMLEVYFRHQPLYKLLD